MDRTLIEQYAAGADEPAQAIEGLTPAELLAHPVPGTWSIQQIVLHLLDSDLIASHRMKRIIAEDKPLLIAYDETAFAARLGYEQLNVREAVELFRLNRLQTAAILRNQPDAAFDRAGVHNQNGLVTLADLVRAYVEHLRHHLKFAYEKRKLLGKSG